MSVEKEIIEKGLTAPRVTPEHIEDAIVSTASHVFPGTTVTVVVLTLRNGFNVVGHSACASPENFDAELGIRIARDDAKQKIWALEGYLLKQYLHDSVPTGAPQAEQLTGRQRVVLELEQLSGRLLKLTDFLGTEAFKILPDEQRILLEDQQRLMSRYERVLAARLNIWPE